ncbi:hypothetical protein AB0N29_09075 [Nocardioides sp. NPDC092400]|uniref:hypothetical protein n=1 Tax=Nocardioides sp. NPDC092400 TaxID=3155196 RepID=UPI003417174F
MTEDRDKDAPSLEPPRLFGRKRRQKDERPAEVVPPQVEDRADAEPTLVDVPVVEPDQTPTAAVPPVAAPAPVVEPEPAPEPVREPVVEPPAAPPVREPVREPVARRVPVSTPASPPPPAEPAPPLFVEQALREPADHAPAEQEPEQPAAPREPWEPFVTGMAAACLVGALVGLGTVALTWAGLRACEVAQGTSSCGNPGFLLLLAILVAMVLAGSALLKAFRVADPGSTSFLAVGLLTVLVLLFLIEVLFSWTMVIVIPLLAVGCFALSHWVTTTFVETDAD